MDCPYAVGGIVSRDGTDEHRVTEVRPGSLLFDVVCIKEPLPHPGCPEAGPWTRIGQEETNVWQSYEFVRHAASPSPDGAGR